MGTFLSFFSFDGARFEVELMPLGTVLKVALCDGLLNYDARQPMYETM